MKQQWILACGTFSMLILSACAGLSNKVASYSDDECHEAWFSLSIPWTSSDEEVIDDILNKEHPPDTVGERLQSCIRRGWRPLSAGEQLDILTCGGEFTIEEVFDYYPAGVPFAHKIEPNYCDWMEAAPAPFITIVQPGEGAELPVPESVPIWGQAGGLFENSLVVQAFDSEGTLLAQEPTTLDASEPRGTGNWEVDMVIPVKPGTSGLIFTSSTSPVDGSITASASVEVIYGEEIQGGTD